MRRTDLSNLVIMHARHKGKTNRTFFSVTGMLRFINILLAKLMNLVGVNVALPYIY